MMMMMMMVVADVVVVLVVLVDVASSIVESHCPRLLEGNINHRPVREIVKIVGSVRRVLLDRSLDSD